MGKYSIIKIISIILIISTLIYIPNISKAADIIKDAFSQAEDFLNTPPSSEVKISDNNIIEISKQIYKVVMILGIVVAAVIIMVLGIQFMTGSIEQQAKVKEMLVPFGVGCVVVFGSLTIWRIVVSVMSSVV